MKVAVSSIGPDLTSEVDPRFGRCQFFVLVNTEDMSFEAMANGNLTMGSGVGIQSAKVVADKGAEVVLTGNIGPNAHQVLSDVGVQVITGVSGTVQDVVKEYEQGGLRPATAPNVENGFGSQTVRSSPVSSSGTIAGRGMGGGRGTGRGRGMGGGRGGGCGRGMACRGGFNMTREASDAPVSREEELSYLKQGARTLREQMEEVERRIKELEKEEP